MTESALSLISGSLAGAASTVAGAPLDFVKTRLQTHGSVYVREGNAYMMRTFFAGTQPAVVSSVLENGVVFAANTTLKRAYASVRGGDQQRGLSRGEVATIGALSGVISATAISPAETIKVRLQSHPEKWTSATDCLVRTVRHEGGRSLFKGLPAQMARDVPFVSVFFTSYSWITDMLKSRKNEVSRSANQLSSFETVMAGGLAGAAGWTVTLPMDIVKTRAQAASSSSHESLARLSMKVAQNVFEESGVRGFFRGWSVVTLRAFPVNGVTFLVYEASQSALNGNGFTAN